MSRLMESRLAASGLDALHQKILHGVRLDFRDGLALYQTRESGLYLLASGRFWQEVPLYR